jgi:rubredoxin
MKDRAQTRAERADSRMAEPKLRMECGVCWSVYDPAKGDSVWQIEPGVAFEDLPADWRCPECDAPREKFLRREDEP